MGCQGRDGMVGWVVLRGRNSKRHEEMCCLSETHFTWSQGASHGNELWKKCRWWSLFFGESIKSNQGCDYIVICCNLIKFKVLLDLLDMRLIIITMTLDQRSLNFLTYKVICLWRRQSLWPVVLGKLNFYIQKHKMWYLQSNLYKLYSKLMKDLNLRLHTINVWQEKIGKLQDIDLGRDFLEKTPDI